MTNQDLLAIAKEFGTPVYVYDVNSIREQYEKLTSSFLFKTVASFRNEQYTNGMNRNIPGFTVGINYIF